MKWDIKMVNLGVETIFMLHCDDLIGFQQKCKDVVSAEKNWSVLNGIVCRKF